MENEQEAFGISFALTAGVACCLSLRRAARLRLRARTRGADAAKCRRPADDTRQRALRHPCQLGRDACRTRQQRRLRSFIIIGIGCSLLWLYASGKLRSSLTIAGITILCLADMWGGQQALSE